MHFSIMSEDKPSVDQMPSYDIPKTEVLGVKYIDPTMHRKITISDLLILFIFQQMIYWNKCREP